MGMIKNYILNMKFNKSVKDLLFEMYQGLEDLTFL